MASMDFKNELIVQYSGESKSLGEKDDPFFQYLISTKLASNLDRIRRRIIEENLINDDSKGSIGDFQANFSGLEEFAESVQYSSETKLQQKYDEYVESQKTRRYSIDFDAAPEISAHNGNHPGHPVESNEDEDSLDVLRQRLLGKQKENEEQGEESFDKQMKIQDDLQKELLDDMGKLVSGLKEGAEAFQTALDHDSTVLKAAEIGLQVTSKSLSSLGGKIKKYHKEKLGFFMKIGLLLFIILGLLLTYLIIKIFPDL